MFCIHLVFCVYLVTNLANEKCYVGWTIDLKNRWRHHRWTGSGCVALKRAIAKYGIDHFVIHPIEWCETDTDAKDAERFWISWYDSFGPRGYNLTAGGDGSLGFRHSRETREKMSIAHQQESDETRARKSAAALRRSPPSAEAIMKSAIARRGQKRSDEFRAKIAAIARSRPPPTKQTRAKISAALRAKLGGSKIIIDGTNLPSGPAREAIVQALADSCGNRIEAARSLGVSRTTLGRMILGLHIE